MKKPIIALFASILSVSANASPSKSETIDYIKRNLILVHEYRDTRDEFLLDINPKKCSVSYSFKKYINNKIDSETVEVALLSEFDPNEVYSSNNWQEVGSVGLNCLEGKKCMKRTGRLNNGKNYIETRSRISLLVKKNKTKRLTKAFSHLIKLCGGKAELF